MTEQANWADCESAFDGSITRTLHKFMLKQIYIRFRDNLPDGINCAAASDGFTRLGVKVIPFYHPDELENFPLSEEVGVTGFIVDVNKAFELMKIKPKMLDSYPESLRSFFGRNIQKTTLGKIRESENPLFVKSVSQKLFTGLVFDNEYYSRVKTAIYSDDLEVYSSDLVKFVSEYRSFGLNKQILDVRRYAGDWSFAPNKEVVHACYKAFVDAPSAFSLDFGITDDGRTLLVEANDALSLGNYGLNTEAYANMIESRWTELVEKHAHS